MARARWSAKTLRWFVPPISSRCFAVRASFYAKSSQPIGYWQASKCTSGHLYETTSSFDRSRTVGDIVAGHDTGMGRKQRNDPVADPGSATAGADDRHAA